MPMDVVRRPVILQALGGSSLIALDLLLFRCPVLAKESRRLVEKASDTDGIIILDSRFHAQNNFLLKVAK